MENISLLQELKKIGLSDKEARIYSVLLNLGSAYPSKIAQIAKLNRTTAYAVLSNLSNKGLISAIEKNNKIFYQIEKPHKLLTFTQSRIQSAEDGFDRAKKVLPELEGMFNLTPNKPKVRFFEGADGLMSIFSDHIAVKQSYEMLAYSNVEDLMKFIPPTFVQKYVKAKERMGITTRAIFPDNTFSQSYNRRVYKGLDKKTHIEMRLIPASAFTFKSEITIYDSNKVSIVNFQKKSLVGVIIEDKTIADMMRMIFELAWVGAKSFSK